MMDYHYCAGPHPPRATHGPHRLRDGINLDFSENETTLPAVPPLIKELLIMTHVLTILHITYIMEGSGRIDTYHTQTMIQPASAEIHKCAVETINVYYVYYVRNFVSCVLCDCA